MGPTHPYTGGIAQHTARLALELEARSISVRVESWKRQYPALLYRGKQFVEGAEPEIGNPVSVCRRLKWYSPISWVMAGRRAQGSERIVLNIPTPFHAIPYALVMLAAPRKSRLVGVVHNVLPHERSPLDVTLVRWLLAKLDFSIVHGEAEKRIAEGIGVQSEKLVVRRLPSPWYPIEKKKKDSPSDSPPRALFFGAIRDYKGLEVLIEAIAQTSRMRLLIAGEFWGNKEKYLDLIRQFEIQDRVEIRDGYVAEQEFGALFSSSSIMVLPYTSGTGSSTAKLALSHGLPVIASDAGSVADGVIDGQNGRIVGAGSVEDLKAALSLAEQVNTLALWSKNANSSRGEETLWSKYCSAVLEEGN